LICIQHELLFTQTIHLVEFLNLCCYTLGTRHQTFEFVDGRSRFGHLVEMNHASFVRLRMWYHHIIDLNILHNARLLTFRAQMIEVTLDSSGI